MSFSGTFNDGINSHSIGADSDGEAGRRATLSYNPAELDAVASIKGFAACAMQAVIVARRNVKADYERGPKSIENIAAFTDAMRDFATALTQLQSAKMFAVNGVFAGLAAEARHPT